MPNNLKYTTSSLLGKSVLNPSTSRRSCCNARYLRSSKNHRGERRFDGPCLYSFRTSKTPHASDSCRSISAWWRTNYIGPRSARIFWASKTITPCNETGWYSTGLSYRGSAHARS